MPTVKKTGQKATKSRKTKAAAGRKVPDAGKSSPNKNKSAARKQQATTAVIDRRTDAERRRSPERRKEAVPVGEDRRKLQRRAKVNRRRQIDPTTCERDYTADEIEFMSALEQYKRTSGRMFPTCSEVLEVIRKLGYEKRPPVQPEVVVEAAEPSTPPAAEPELVEPELVEEPVA